jgi:hypothetical protein
MTAREQDTTAMGTLAIGSNGTLIDIDDRTLGHLRVVILAKLRRGESFAFNWDHAEVDEMAAATTWMQPTMEVEFSFDTEEPVVINKRWADRLMHSANSVKGLEIIPEATAAPGVEDELGANALPR